MASKTKNDFKLINQFGRLTLQMTRKGNDGRIHSVSCEYPMKGDSGCKLSRKATIDYLWRLVAPFYKEA